MSIQTLLIHLYPNAHVPTLESQVESRLVWHTFACRCAFDDVTPGQIHSLCFACIAFWVLEHVRYTFRVTHSSDAHSILQLPFSLSLALYFLTVAFFSFLTIIMMPEVRAPDLVRGWTHRHMAKRGAIFHDSEWFRWAVWTRMSLNASFRTKPGWREMIKVVILGYIHCLSDEIGTPPENGFPI